MKLRSVVLILIINAIGSNAIAGGGWTQGKSRGFFMLNQRYIGGSFYANNMGQILDLEDDWAGVFSTHLYGEYGLTNKLDFILHSQLFVTSFYTDRLPSSFLNVRPPAAKRNENGFGDTDLALKYNLYNKGPQVSATLLFGIPTGRKKPGFYGQTSTLTGDGEFNQMLKVDVSNGFGNNLFYTFFAGFNNRTNGFSDELHIGGEIGRSGQKVVSILKLYYLSSFENGSTAVATIPGIYSNNLEYLSISPSFLYKFSEKSGLMLDLGFAPYLRNIIAAPSFTVGFWLKR